MSKVSVSYFSATGVTKGVAKKVATDLTVVNLMKNIEIGLNKNGTK